MGWFWQSSSPSDAASGSSTTQQTQQQQPPAQPQAPLKPETSKAADPEVQKIWDMINDAINKDPRAEGSGSGSAVPATTPSTTTTTQSSSFASKFSITKSEESKQQQAAPEKDKRSPQSIAMSEHLLPTDMSCRDAFDYAWHCQTPGSQWNSVHKYGGWRPCSELWDDFWFCMRIKSFSPEMRTAAIKAHFRAKEHAKYGLPGKPSSEDVWESRDEPVPPGTAFTARFEAPRESDAEFQLKELERRKRVRKELGFEPVDGGEEGGKGRK